MNIMAIWVAFFSIFLPLSIPFSRIWKSSAVVILPQTPEDRRQRFYFLTVGTPIGIAIGFLVHIPIVFDVLHLPQIWFFALIQGLTSIFYIPILIIVMGVRGMSFIVKTNFYEKNRGISEGIFVAFVAWQVVLFFAGRYDVLIPGFSDSLQQMRDYFMNFRG